MNESQNENASVITNTLPEHFLENLYAPTYENAGYFGALFEFQKALAKKTFLNPLSKYHRTGQLFVPGSPSAELAATLIAEETGELIEALGQKSADEVLKEVVDVIYVAVRVAAIYGWKLEEAFERVHKNNMAKIETGTVRPDGKLVKPVNHPKVDLKDCV